MATLRPIAAALCLLVPAVAFAQAPLDEAKTRFKRGTELYDENNFRAALVEFQRAYELAPSFRLLYNIGQVQLQLQDYAGALRSLGRYMTEGGPDVPPARRDEVLAEVEKLKGRVAKLIIETAPGVEVLIDDASVGFAPLPDGVMVNTGRHKVTVNIGGKDAASRFVDVAGQQTLTVVLANDRSGAPDAVATGAAPPHKPLSRGLPVALWVGTGALGIAAGIVGASALTASNRLVALRGTFGTTRADLDAFGNRVQTLSLVSDVLTCTALAAGIIALVVTLAGDYSDPKATVMQVALGPMGLGVGGRF